MIDGPEMLEYNIAATAGFNPILSQFGINLGLPVLSLPVAAALLFANAANAIGGIAKQAGNHAALHPNVMGQVFPVELWLV